jgi:hypothetical protein
LNKINGQELDTPLYPIGPTEIGDYDENAIFDLMVKFDRQALMLLLTPGDANLSVSFELTDGTPFESSNTIRVIDKGRK